jgi:deferrochelatase/peroxidase EfeB
MFKNNTFGYADDEHGYRTPVISHIRKVNPRNLDTDQGPSARSLKRRILRRGIPFGPPYNAQQNSDTIDGNRGLMFLSYQASISEQFEFLTKRWINRKDLPSNAPSPEGHDSGYDLLIGQNVEDGRIRSAYIQANVNDETVEAQISTKGLDILEWVIPTGGGYFFSPSISAVKSVFGGN